MTQRESEREEGVGFNWRGVEVEERGEEREEEEGSAEGTILKE